MILSGFTVMLSMHGAFYTNRVGRTFIIVRTLPLYSENMSEEEIKRNLGSPTEPISIGDSEYKAAPEPESINDNQSLRKALRLDGDEELLLIRRPSFFAFMPAYLVGLGVLLLHLFFRFAEAPDDASAFVKILYILVDVAGWAGGAGFAFVMLFYTWINRVINHPASGRWMTTVLLLSSLTPFLLHIDDVVRLFSDSEFELPGFMDWNYTLYGIFWTALIWAVTFWYQRSFLYAVTSDRVIHHQKFIYERDGLTFLHEKIVAVMKSRSPIGALFGYATVHCNIGDQSHISTESVGGAIAVNPSDSSTNSGGALKWIGRIFFMITYQRTVKVERFTPDISFYGIRHWEEAYDLMLNKMDEHSAVTKAEEQLEVQKQMVDLLAKAAKDGGDDDLPDLDDLLES